MRRLYFPKKKQQNKSTSYKIRNNKLTSQDKIYKTHFRRKKFHGNIFLITFNNHAQNY